MAFTFRYRYVDFSTVFTGDPQLRGAESGADAPGTLFANEIALDVGRTCWGPAEPLAIIDHHFAQDGLFPSTTAAVLHKSALIHQKFTNLGDGVVWLVTHKEPDFDAFSSIYLARWIVEQRDATITWEPHGLHPDGWLDLNGRRRIDWFDPDLSAVPAEHRWALLLASYASRLNNNRPITCPRPRALHSVLYAALKRGRDYLANGAQEFFDEVRERLQQGKLNPVFDSGLQDSTEFAPELTMLDREDEAYPRDLKRARKAIVYLPEAEAPSPKFFKSGKDAILLPERPPAPEIDAEHLLLADSFRIATDGIYLRDPECQLFREWARLDLENSSLGAGYEFTAISTSNGRPAGTANQSEYVFSIDPGRAKGRHLYTVWSRLQTTEVEALRAMREERTLTSHQNPHTLETLLSDPWSEGQNDLGTLVDTPHRGTLIGPAGTRSDLRDDPVMEAVRTELEGPIYSAESLVTGPQVTVVDFAAENPLQDVEPRRLNLNAPLQIPPPPEKHFRFGSIRLRADVSISSERGLAMQIGDVLWQVLYPETPGDLPRDFAGQHLVVTSDNVGVWSERGIVLAEKQRSTANARPLSTLAQHEIDLREDFAAIVTLGRDVRNHIAGMKNGSYQRSANVAGVADKSPAEKNSSLQSRVAEGEELLSRAGEVEQMLRLRDRELLRRFYQASGADQLVASLGESHAAAVEQLQREKLATEKKRTDEATRSLSLSRWVIAFLTGLLAVGIVTFAAENFGLDVGARRWLALLGGPAVAAITALLLKPWKLTGSASKTGFIRSTWWLVAGILAFTLAWLAALSNFWSK